MPDLPPDLCKIAHDAYRRAIEDADPGAAHEPDPLEARVIALEARVAQHEDVFIRSIRSIAPMRGRARDWRWQDDPAQPQSDNGVDP